MLTRTRTRPIGLHLGAQTATLVQLSGHGDALEVHALSHADLPIDESLSADIQDREVAAAVRRLVADNHFRGRQVVSCLNSQQLFVQNIRLPKLPPEEVDKVVRWEAEERLPYPVQDAEIRYLLAGEVRQDANVKQEVILLACHTGVLQRHIALLEMAGLSPVGIDVEPCALLRSMTQHQPSQAEASRTLLVHFGERATAVIISDQQQVLFLKYIAGGSGQFDQAVARHLGLGLREASRTRASLQQASELDSTNEVHRTLAEAIRPALDAVCSEIELCLRYYKVTFRGQPLERQRLTGAEASPWLAEYLGERLGLPCELANPFAALPRAPRGTSLNSPGRWATALGLALKSV